MSIITSDYISGWYGVSRKNDDTTRYFVKSISNSTNLSIQAENAIQGEAGTIIINQSGQKDEMELSGDALIYYDFDGNNIVNPVNLPGDFIKDIIDIFITDYRKLMTFFLFSTEYLNNSLKYFRYWTGIVSQNGGIIFQTDIISLFNFNNFTSFKTKWDSITATVSQSLRTTVRAENFIYSLYLSIQPVRNLLWFKMIDTNTALSLYYEQTNDMFNYTISNPLNYFFNQSLYGLSNIDLLKSANITIGNDINCNLSYLCKYTDKFDISYDPSGNSSFDYDFICRTAKNYDCRFYVDGNNYRIKSGSMSISFDYTEVYCANTESRYPFFSPQSYQITGSLKIIAKHDEYETIPLEGNSSILIGTRFIPLGRASVKSSYTRSLNPEEIQEIDVKFTVYARASMGIEFTDWVNTYMKYVRV